MYNKMTIKDAAELYVNRELTAIPQAVAEKLIRLSDYTDFTEITPVGECARVWSNEYQSAGEVIGITEDEDGNEVIKVELDNGEIIGAAREDLSREDDDGLPMWSTMWAFGSFEQDKCEDKDFLIQLANIGFRIYESEDYGYVIGIDGAGYDFYEAHWIPLYKLLGLHWHDVEEE